MPKIKPNGQYRVNTSNGKTRVMSGAEILEQQRKEKQFTAAKDQTIANLKSLKGKPLVGETGAGNYKFAIKTEVESMADGALHINCHGDKLHGVQWPKTITKNVDPDLRALIFKSIVMGINDLLSEATKVQKEATRPITDLIGGLEALEEAQKAATEEVPSEDEAKAS